MKKLILIPLISIFIQFQAKPAALVVYPGEIMLSAFVACGSGPRIRTLQECIKFTFKAPYEIGRTGLRMIGGAFDHPNGLVIYTSDNGPGFIGRVLGIIVGTLLLDADSGQVSLTELDYNSLPEGISMEEAITYNTYLQETEMVLNEVNLITSRETTTYEYLNSFSNLLNELDIPQSVAKTIFKLTAK